MQGAQACQLPIAGVRLLFQRHAAKHVMRLYHVSLRTARRWLAKGFVPARILALALPVIDAEIARRVAKLEALQREIEAAEVELAQGACPVAPGVDRGAPGAAPAPDPGAQEELTIQAG